MTMTVSRAALAGLTARVLVSGLAISLAGTASSALAQGTARERADALAQALVAQMTTQEKIAQLVNVAPAIPRLQIPAYNWWTESLHGAIGAVPTTNFPEPVGLAATFDAPLVHAVAGTVSIENRALHTLARQTGHLGTIGTGLDTWSPNINIFRDPRWGRGQETYGEDPFLTARLGVAFVTGMQGPDPELPLVIATPKHFAVHSGPESTRHVANVFASPHDLEDTYLPAFRAAIVEGKAGSVMCAYNRIDGQPACASDLLLKDHLRGAWGFTGYVVSDCDAVVDIADHHKYAPDPAAGVAVALKAGVDNECNTRTIGGETGLGVRYADALQRGLLTTTDLDRALVRLFSARYRNGDLPGLAERRDPPVPVAAIGTPQNRALALRTAVESLVLLKNNGVLPLRAGTRIAVIGPLGDATRVLRGNYSSALSAPPVSVIDGLRAAMPQARITMVPFTASITDGDPVPDSVFVTPEGTPGLRATYFNALDPAAPVGQRQFANLAAATRIEPGLNAHGAGLAQVDEVHKVVWTGAFVAPATGTYRLGITGMKGSIEIGGQPLVRSDHFSQWAEPVTLVDVDLRQGERYPLHFEAESKLAAAPGLIWKRIVRDGNAALAAGIADADVIVAAVGLTSDLEGEEMPVTVDGFAGGDKTSLELPADQRALLERAAASGKPLVVVAMNGSPINLAWARDHAAAIVEAWYPGQAGGLAVGQVLAGAANPAGRLPLTFYRDVADLPAFDDYRMAGRTYRYFTGTPVYGFGYGLSYTTFAYAHPRVEAVTGDPANGLRVSVDVRNTGARDGDEVVQAYLKVPQLPGAPRIALRGFSRIALKAGETRTVTLDLSPRDLSAVDPDGRRRVFAGHYRISLGGGQPDSGLPQVSAEFDVAKPVDLPL
jgi:beta-glucosidase